MPFRIPKAPKPGQPWHIQGMHGRVVRYAASPLMLASSFARDVFGQKWDSAAINTLLMRSGVRFMHRIRCCHACLLLKRKQCTKRSVKWTVTTWRRRAFNIHTAPKHLRTLMLSGRATEPHPTLLGGSGQPKLNHTDGLKIKAVLHKAAPAAAGSHNYPGPPK